MRRQATALRKADYPRMMLRPFSPQYKPKLAGHHFGRVAAHFTDTGPVRSALQTVLVGGLAAAAPFGIARAIA